MTAVLDAGALIALDRGDRAMWTRWKAARADGPGVTHGGIVGQVWRDGARQARLATALAGTDVVPLDDTLGRAAGRLLGDSGTSDVTDAALVAIAADGDIVYTSDPGDVELLAIARGVHVEIVPV